jgi:hypothetical protein
MPGTRSGPATRLAETAAGDARPRSGGGEPLPDPVLERLEAMRRHLSESSPQSGNEALRLLREAFPDAPLADRARALASIARRMP